MMTAKIIIAACACAMLVSCNKNEVVEITPPTVSFDKPSGVYNVKKGRVVTITAIVKDAAAPQYTWVNAERTVVGTGLSYEFTGDETGDYYLTFKVKASNGTAEQKVRVSVVDLALPVISFAVADDGFLHAVKGRELKIEPNVLFGDGADAVYLWSGGSDGKTSDGKTYTFNSAATGKYTVTLTVTNDDGEATKSVIVLVEDAPTMTIAFAEPIVNVPVGRAIILAPDILDASADATFTWYIDGAEQLGQNERTLEFTDAQEDASYVIKITGTDGDIVTSGVVTVVGIKAEGAHYRPATPQSSARESRVIEFLPAPGQFINEGYKAATMAEACARAEASLAAKSYVSLGGFGGYITVGFDHSISSSGDRDDFAILGNPHANSSEPGIVWVMQDENGNGKADDTWYELKGSETATVQNYAVTYYRPAADGMKIQWTDNLGGSGTIDRMTTHTQAYFPAWVTTSTYTLRGRRLTSSNFYDNATHEWILPSYGWGYADNYEPEGKNADQPAANYFRIQNAIRSDGSPANLGYIDFIKVQTGVNGKSGALGETSTEVCGFTDLNIN